MERERLTITLRKDILKLVDQSIDGAKLRNRSHAIEYFLSQQLTGKTARVAFVLSTPSRTLYQAGGMQIGMRDQINTNTPDAQQSFENLLNQGFKDLLIVGADNNAVQAAAVDADKLGLNAKTATIETNGGTAADLALAQVSNQLKDETFIYWDGRFPAGLKLADFLDFHKSSKSLATVALAQASNGQGNTVGLLAQLYGPKVSAIQTTDSARNGGLPVFGIIAIEPEVLATIQNGQSLYRDILPRLALEGKLSGFPFVFENQMNKQPAGVTH